MEVDPVRGEVVGEVDLQAGVVVLVLTQRDWEGLLARPLETEQMEDVGSPPPLARRGQQVLQRELQRWAQ